MHECDNSNSKIQLAETPKTLEERGEVVVDNLMELNLRTNEEPRHIYMSSLRTAKEEKRVL